MQNQSITSAANGKLDTHYSKLELVPDHDPLRNADGSVNWFAAWAATDDKVNWIVEPFLEEGMTHSLFGIPGHGKSLFVMETVAHHVIPGRHVLYLDSENHLTRVVTKRMKTFGMTPGVLHEWLHFYSFADIPPLDGAEGGAEILRLARLHHAELVIIDTTSRFVDGPEDKADTFKAFYNQTMMPLKREDIATLRLDHPGKDISRGTRGSSAKLGDIDYEFVIEDPDGGKTKYRTVTCSKGRTQNISRGDVIKLEKMGITENNDRFYHKWEPPKTGENTAVPVVPDVEILRNHGIAPNMTASAVAVVLRSKGEGMSKTRICAALRIMRDGSEPAGTGSELYDSM